MSALTLPFQRKPALPKVEGYFGGCPHCGKDSGYVNVGREHWFVCDDHKTKWFIGENLFSSWQDESEKDWLKNQYLLANYRSVKPLRCTVPADEGGAA